jgi:hypothetical protein
MKVLTLLPKTSSGKSQRTTTQRFLIAMTMDNGQWTMDNGQWQSWIDNTDLPVIGQWDRSHSVVIAEKIMTS